MTRGDFFSDPFWGGSLSRAFCCLSPQARRAGLCSWLTEALRLPTFQSCEFYLHNFDRLVCQANQGPKNKNKTQNKNIQMNQRFLLPGKENASVQEGQLRRLFSVLQEPTGPTENQTRLPWNSGQGSSGRGSPQRGGVTVNVCWLPHSTLTAGRWGHPPTEQH